jgi:hypothetical protein
MSPIPRKLVLILCTLTLAACAPDAADDEMEMEEAAETEQPAETPMMEDMSPMAQWAGTWEGTAILESGDTVPITIVATDSREGWMATLPDREPMPLRVVSADGSSVVLEMGPYESVLRDGVQVSVSQTLQIQGDSFTGTLNAMYEGGEGPATVAGTVEGSKTN